MKKLTLIILVAFSFVFTFCKKENPIPVEDNIDSNIYSLTLDKSNYNQLEVISIEKSGISHSVDLYAGMVGNDSVGVVINDNIISFIAPYNPQSNVTLKVSIDGVEYESTSFNVNQVTNISSPDIVFNDFLSLKTSLVSYTNVLIDSMANYPATFNTSTYNLDQTILDNHWNSVNQDFQTLSNSEKEYVATFIKANEHVFQDCVDAIQDFVTAIPPYLPKTIDIDLEELNKTRAQKMVAAAYKASEIIGIAVAGGFFTSAVATPIAGVVTAGIILGWNGEVFKNLIAEYDIFKNSALSIVIDDLTMTKVNILIDDNVLHPLEIKTNYRSLNNQTDFSSTLMSNVRNTLDFIYNNYSRISSYFSFNTTVESVSNMNTYETFNLDIHAKYITISDISNPNVELVSQTNNNGTLDVMFKNNQPGTNQDFTFKLNYQSDFGTDFRIINGSINNGPLRWTGNQSNTPPYAKIYTGGLPFPCNAELHWSFAGGLSPYQVKIVDITNTTSYPQPSNFPTSGTSGGTQWESGMPAYCNGNQYSMTVKDALGDSITHIFGV